MLMSGFLDGEIGEDDRQELERHLASCQACTAEFEKMKRIVDASAGLSVAPPPEEVWDAFMDGVWNRTERRTGWVIFVVGIAVLAAWGLYAFVTDPWGTALVKIAVATPVVGLGILFISILRQRMFVAKTDRYSREVKR